MVATAQACVGLPHPGRAACARVRGMVAPMGVSMNGPAHGYPATKNASFLRFGKRFNCHSAREAAARSG